MSDILQKISRQLDGLTVAINGIVYDQRRLDGRLDDQQRQILAMKEGQGGTHEDMGRTIKAFSSLERMQNKQSEALGAIVEELGIEDKVQLGRSVPPGTAPPVPVLKKMVDEGRKSTAFSLMAIIMIALQIVLKLLETHQ